ncbi:MAG: hypothetical protein A2W84_01305 [Bacteroidetes bacterium GWC2_40_13]|nr:MAG: hypothetical protein A2W84_01305 [Bacteroidetes bacterium GWC2_40_13]HBX85469.1 hypothetical protein [Marinilabiliales bacterium]
MQPKVKKIGNFYQAHPYGRLPNYKVPEHDPAKIAFENTRQPTCGNGYSPNRLFSRTDWLKLLTNA